MKLAIGTAQFGYKYGITNSTGQVNINQIKKILNFSKQNKIFYLDTAIDYGESEKIIGNLKLKNFQIITKLPSPPYNEKNLEEWTEKKILKSLKLLKVKKIYALLLHNPNQLNLTSGRRIYEAIIKLKKKKIIKKIGVSVYNRKELNNILKMYKIDIVNLPLSFANREFLKDDCLKKLKKNKIEIHVRSIFLQGLLVNYFKDDFKYLLNTNFFKKWDLWLKKNKINSIDACVNFVKKIKEVDKIIVGIDNFEQLKFIFRAYQRKDSLIFPFFNIHKKIINPQYWKLNEKKIF